MNKHKPMGELTDAALKKLEEIEALSADRDTLINDLRRSLAIERLWPDAFEHGRPVKSKAIGNVHTRIQFTITAGDASRTFDLTEVPKILWPAELRKQSESAYTRRLPAFKKLAEVETC